MANTVATLRSLSWTAHFFLALIPAHAQDAGRTARLAEANADVHRLIKRGVPKENIRIAYVIENGRLGTYAIYYTSPDAVPWIVIGGREIPADRVPGMQPGYIRLIAP